MSKSFADGSASGRTDFVDVTYRIQNTCAQRIRFDPPGSPRSRIFLEVEVWDNTTQSGTPLGTGLADPFEIAPNTTATFQDLVILDRGAITDIPGPDALVLFAAVNFVP